MRERMKFHWLVITVVAWTLPLVCSSSPSPPPETTAPLVMEPVYNPVVARGVSITQIIEIATYALCAVAGAIVVGSMTAGRQLCACLSLRQLNAFFLMLWGVDILAQFAFHTNTLSLLLAVGFIILHIVLLVGLHWKLRMVTSAEDLAAAIRLRQAAIAHRAARAARHAAANAPVPFIRMDSALFVLVLQPDYKGPLLLDWNESQDKVMLDPSAPRQPRRSIPDAPTSIPAALSASDVLALSASQHGRVQSQPQYQSQQQQGAQLLQQQQGSVDDRSVTGALKKWRAAIMGEVVSQRLRRSSIIGDVEMGAVVEHQLQDASGTYTSLSSFFPDGREPSETADGLWHTPYDAMRLWSAGEKGIAYALLIRERPDALPPAFEPTCVADPLDPPVVQESPARDAASQTSIPTTVGATNAASRAVSHSGSTRNSSRSDILSFAAAAVISGLFPRANSRATLSQQSSANTLLQQNSGWQVQVPAQSRPSTSTSIAVGQANAGSTSTRQSQAGYLEHSQGPNRDTSSPRGSSPTAQQQRASAPTIGDTAANERQEEQQRSSTASRHQRGLSVTLPRPSSNQWAQPSPTARSRRGASFAGSPSPSQSALLPNINDSDSHENSNQQQMPLSPQILLTDIILDSGSADPSDHPSSPNHPPFRLSSSSSLSVRGLSPTSPTNSSLLARRNSNNFNPARSIRPSTSPPPTTEHHPQLRNPPPTEPLFSNSYTSMTTQRLEDISPDPARSDPLAQHIILSPVVHPRTFSGRKIMPFAPTPPQSPPPTPSKPLAGPLQ